jgi:hypothetical protein
MRNVYIIVPAVALFACRTLGQITTTNNSAGSSSLPSTVEDTQEKAWSFTASAYTYVVADSRDYVQPTLTADRGWLHLEARYNYEALETGSAWIGYNLSAGKDVTLEFTPMVGGVFGDLTGVAPGCKVTLSWWKLSLYSEDEYVFDTGDSSGNFFYAWSELTLAPVDWFRFGVVGQRTQAYKSDREIQRGVMAGFSFKRVDLSAYLFNPDEDKPTFVFAVAVNF